MTNEQQAIEYGSDPKQVEKRLRSASRLLLTRFRRDFENGAVFWSGKKMLVSKSERYALVWMLRNHPDLLEGYDNNQTTQGIVQLIVIGGFEVNPN